MKNFLSHENMKEIDEHLTTPVLVIIGLTLLIATCVLFDKKRDADLAYKYLVEETSGMKEELLIYRAEVDKLNILIGEQEQDCKVQIDTLEDTIKKLSMVVPINKEDK